MSSAARFIVRRRGWVIVLWSAIVALLAPLAAGVDDVLEARASIRGSEAERVAEFLSARLQSPFADYLLLVITGLHPARRPRDQAVLVTIADAIAGVDGVAGVRAYERPADSMFVGTHGGTFIAVGLSGGSQSVEEILSKLRETTHGLKRRLRIEFSTVEMRWTGESVLNADLRRASAADARAGERRALPITLLVLLVVFGALIPAGMPALAGIVTIVCTLGVVRLIGSAFSLSVLVQTFVTMVGLGLGVDYALLIVSRFRERLTVGEERTLAGEEVVRHAGKTLAVSGGAVALGFAGLFLVPLGELRGLSSGGVVAVFIAVAVATTLIPAVFVGVCRWLNLDRWGLWHTSTIGVWRRWGRRVVARPLLVLVVAGIPLALLGWQATRLRTGLPTSDWLPRSMESVRGLDDLKEMGRSGAIQPLRVVIEFPDTINLLDPRGWAVAREVADTLFADPRVAVVNSFVSMSRERPPSRLILAAMSRSRRRSFVSDDYTVLLLEAVPNENVAPGDAIRLARDMRAVQFEALREGSDVRIMVGGLPAFRADYQDSLQGWFSRVFAAVVLATFFILCYAFRSIVIPVKAIALNLASVAGGVGLLVLVFQDGWFLSMLGHAEPVREVFPVVPPLIFCTMFGLSMDYEVFLLSRVAEFRRTGVTDTAALVEGLARSAPVITGAAAIMIVVFGAFALGDFLVIQMLGLGLAATVLIDATLIRMAVGPALLQLAGRWNWWPGSRAS